MPDVLQRHGGVTAETEIPEGWAGPLDSLLGGAAVLGCPAETVYCDEQRSGGARFYLSHGAAAYRDGGTVDRLREVGELIEVAEHRAASTCGGCGRPGRPRAGDGRVSVLCDRHARSPGSVRRIAAGVGSAVDGEAPKPGFPAEFLGAHPRTASGPGDRAAIAAAARAGDRPTAVPAAAAPLRGGPRRGRGATPTPSRPGRTGGPEGPAEDAAPQLGNRPDAGYPGYGDRGLWDALAVAPIPEGFWGEVERMYGEWFDGKDSPEGSRYLTRLELISRFPRARSGAAAVDVRRVQAALDEDHWGLVDVKERILEYVAVLARRTRGGRTPAARRACSWWGRRVRAGRPSPDPSRAAWGAGSRPWRSAASPTPRR